MRSRLDRYLSRDALIYYVLVSPAVVALFAFTVTITPTDLVTGAGIYGEAVTILVELLPLAALAATAYSVFTFRPSVLVTSLVVMFFLAVSVANGTPVTGFRLDLEGSVFVVVTATFFALAGFTFARSIRLAAAGRPDVSTSGPTGYNAFGVILDAAVPLFTAFALVLLVEGIVTTLAAQAVRLPAPLSTMSSLYLGSRIGLVFTTLFVAGATIWVLRQFVEPVILHFTLTATDARMELLSEIEPTSKSIRKVMRYRPSKGLSWGFLTIAYCVGLIAALALFLPTGVFLRDLAAAFDLHAPPPSPVETVVQSSIQNSIVKINIAFAQSQDFLRGLIKLLWG